MSETTTVTLADFLLARIAEDEARWRPGRYPHSLARTERDSYEAPHWPDCDYPGDMTGVCTCPMLARVRAECEAKRQIVEYRLSEGFADDGMVTALRALAAIYADHPDYREEWRP